MLDRLRDVFGQMAGLAGQVADGVGRGLADIRQRVVERGWFGEAVTPRAQTISLGTLDRSAGEQSPADRLGWSSGQQPERDSGSGWFARHFENSPARGDHAERTQPSREQERGIER